MSETKEDNFKENKPLPQSLARVARPSTLERKHSSGDLHSRLKTRKILGVGETDNGDIHRSKISQLLGHNEHLFVRFPKGFWTWNLIMALWLSGQGAVFILAPHRAWDLGLLPQLSATSSSTFLAVRYYGAAKLGLSSLMWSFLRSRDKAHAQASMHACALYYILSAAITLFCGLREGILWRPMVALSMGLNLSITSVSMAYAYQ